MGAKWPLGLGHSWGWILTEQWRYLIVFPFLRLRMKTISLPNQPHKVLTPIPFEERILTTLFS
jgi:hypothetical protein